MITLSREWIQKWLRIE